MNIFFRGGVCGGGWGRGGANGMLLAPSPTPLKLLGGGGEGGQASSVPTPMGNVT